MKRILLTVSLLLAFSAVALAQSVTNGNITLTSTTGAFHSRALVVATGRNFCPSPVGFGGPWSGRVRTSDGITQPIRTYECTPFRLKFALPVIATQIIEITLTDGAISERVVFVAITVPAAPQITDKGRIGVLTNTTFDPRIENGVIKPPRLTYSITLEGSGFGDGGTYLVEVVDQNANSTTYIGKAFPRSSGNATDLLFFEVEALEPGTYYVQGRYGGDQSIRTNVIAITVQ